MQGSKVELALDRRLMRQGYWFDAAEADRVCYFFEEVLVHSKGEWYGRPVRLEPWQRMKLRRLFGWRKPDGTRRYRRSHWWIPKKNGKSLIASGVSLFLSIADGEPGADVYVAASEKEQARMVFDECKKMVEAAPDLEKNTEVFKDSIYCHGLGSRLMVISAKPTSKHGFNPHAIIIDEIHAHPSRALYDVLTMGSTITRRQPMEFVISTAGDDIGHFSYELWEMACKVRDGVLEDPEFLPVVFAADPEDDWEDEATWFKANPNLGVSIKLESFRAQYKKLEGTPSLTPAFKQLNLNIWSQSAAAWLDLEQWRRCAKKRLRLEDYAGRKCWAGLDLSKTTDMSALALVFRNDKEEHRRAAGGKDYDAIVIFWVPEENAEHRAKKDRVDYPTWIRQGHIRATDGNVVDYRRIRADIQHIAGIVSLQEIAYDRAYATELVQNLQDEDGLTVYEHGQGYLSMSAPAFELERLVISNALRIDANPVLTWQASNVVVRRDPAGNIKPDKERSRERIDGIVALVMALGRASVGDETASVYEDRGLLL